MAKSLFLGVCVLMLGACSVIKDTTDTNPGSELLYLSRWDLLSINGQPFSGTDKPYIVFTGAGKNSVTGFGGCNMMFGGFTLSGTDSIHIRPLGATMMACDALTTETAMLDALIDATNWKIENQELTLSKNGVELIAFTGVTLQIIEEAATMRINGTWELNYLNDLRGPLTSAFPQGLPTLIINMPNTKATGNGGCNDYSADIKIENNNLHFGPISATKMFCANNAEHIFFGNLSKVTAWSLEDDNNLVLYNNDVVMMRLTRK